MIGEEVQCTSCWYSGLHPLAVSVVSRPLWWVHTEMVGGGHLTQGHRVSVIQRVGDNHSDVTHCNVTQSDVTLDNDTNGDVTHSDLANSNVANINVEHNNVTNGDVTHINVTQSDIKHDKDTHSAVTDDHCDDKKHVITTSSTTSHLECSSKTMKYDFFTTELESDSIAPVENSYQQVKG